MTDHPQRREVPRGVITLLAICVTLIGMLTFIVFYLALVVIHDEQHFTARHTAFCSYLDEVRAVEQQHPALVPLVPAVTAALQSEDCGHP